MKVGSLFSGIGGLELGLERAGMEVRWQVEKDPFARRVLAKHWPDVPRYEDVHDVDPILLEPVDLIAGGPPCQPFSTASAGRGMGTECDRHLWPQMHRIVQGVRPRFVLVEEVVGFDGPGLEEVVSDLEASGYEVLPPLEIPACAVGHDHWRPRLWVLGHTDSYRKPGRPVDGEVAELRSGGRRSGPRRVGDPHGLSSGLDRTRRLKAIGNAVVPQITEYIGRAIMEVA